MKKAQLKIQQMIFMLLAVVLFLIIAGLFYLSIRVQSIRERAYDLEAQEAVSAAMRLADSPEFTCGKAGCVDADKLIVILERPEYSGFWPVDAIKIVKVFPSYEKEIICDKNNYPDCNVFNVWGTGEDVVYVSSFVSLCRKEEKNSFPYDKCELGKILIGVKEVV